MDKHATLKTKVKNYEQRATITDKNVKNDVKNDQSRAPNLIDSKGSFEVGRRVTELGEKQSKLKKVRFSEVDIGGGVYDFKTAQ